MSVLHVKNEESSSNLSKNLSSKELTKDFIKIHKDQLKRQSILVKENTI
jgi:hypothetical protein